jgi:electron transport complex protein RnfG
MRDIFRLCISLGAVCFLGAVALVYVNEKTLEPREQAQRATLTKSLALVLPAETSDTRALSLPLDEDLQFFMGCDASGQTLAVAGQGSSNTGFGGEVAVLVGLERDGRIRAVMVTRHNETPGLGSKVTERKQLKSLWAVLAGKVEEEAFPANDYLDAFSGRAVGEFVLDGGSAEQRIDGISGATISSRAILNAVNRVCAAYMAHREAIWTTSAQETVSASAAGATRSE